MNASPKAAEAIRQIISNLMNRVMEKALVTDPFIPEEHHAHKPLYAALVPDEIFKGSHFERRFVTPFGNVWEQLAVAVASVHHGVCLQGYTVEGTVGENSLRRIQEVLNRLEHGTQGKRKEKPDWNNELEYVLSGGGGTRYP
ncbi:MAG: TdeIII family type II restriction endonuclease [Pseudoflavonifractor sp.]|nr:TdeIII family type II restriction endonuclease [Alloprevotella sp.]MCM1116260.1 TdeIII family type II restriction endonuclease [Pseudoflavonifractor sp.]